MFRYLKHFWIQTTFPPHVTQKNDNADDFNVLSKTGGVIFISLTYTQDDDKEDLLMMVLVMVDDGDDRNQDPPQCSHQDII